MHQQTSAVNGAQELCSEAGTGMRALDKSRDVRHYEADFVRRLPDHYDSQIWLQGGERVVRNLGPSRGDARDQCGFADIGIPDQADICEQLSFEAQRPLFAGTPVFVLARSLMGGCFELRVAASTASATRYHDPVVGMREVVHLLTRFSVVNDGADGDLKQNVHAFSSGPVRA